VSQFIKVLIYCYETIDYLTVAYINQSLKYN